MTRGFETLSVGHLAILFCELFMCLAHFSFELFAFFFTGIVLLGLQYVLEISVN